MSPRHIILAVAAVAALGLAGCGKRGTLERPDPMWGAPDEDVQAAPEGEDKKPARRAPKPKAE